MGKPKFKTKKDTKQGFKSDRIVIKNGKLKLDKPREVQEKWQNIKIKGLPKDFDANLTVVSVTKVNDEYYASLPYKTNVETKVLTSKATAIDVNVGHFNYTDGNLNILPKKLNFYYSRIKHYQKMLAKKRVTKGKNACKSNNYLKVRTKLQRDYEKTSNLTHDILHKFTTMLTDKYDTIVIEDLDVKYMQMTHVASKGLQRSCFGLFRQLLTYKCNWYGRELIIADRFYPSTQRCSHCGHVKTGEDKITLSGNHIWYITRSDHYHLLIRGDNFNVDLWNGNKNMSGYTGWCSRGQTELNGTKYNWEDAMPSMETLIKLDILIEQYYLNKFKENTK